eukprot:TRINITY_DN6043_c4_g2_i1.p1 TRINITY_DN6043_c4_g2~~TRINITY_DN6043_c4_g2_i1.p1  ORF type:complete len:611 (+),score=70.76 TRINITY_DN6043_c4_g2_i1:61-1833(+)
MLRLVISLLLFQCAAATYNIGPIDVSVPVALNIRVAEGVVHVNWTTGVPPQNPVVYVWKASDGVKSAVSVPADGRFFFAVGNPQYHVSAKITGLTGVGAGYIVVASDYDKNQDFRLRSASSFRLPFNFVEGETVGNQWCYPGYSPGGPVFYDSLRTPEQIHLSTSGSDNGLLITWKHTLKPDTAFITTFPLLNGTWMYKNAVNHTVQRMQNLTYPAQSRWYVTGEVANLTPGATYGYVVTGVFSGQAFKSSPTVFKVLEEGVVPRICFIGDFGLYQGLVAPELTRLVNNDEIDLIIHVGDIAYNLPDENGSVGDRWLVGVSPSASQVPYLVSPGNHDTGGPTLNFSDFSTRFAMPQYSSFSSLFWRQKIGPLLLLSFNSEGLFSYNNETDRHYETQYNWLANQLENVDSSVKWIIAFAHRPMYCGFSGYKDCCSITGRSTRFGVLNEKTNQWQFGLEQLFAKHKVDLIVTGHVHSYERFWPTFSWGDGNGSASSPYTNPTAPVHIICGASGTAEGCDPFYGLDSITHQHVWPYTGNALNISAFRTEARGYGIVSPNNGKLRYQQFACGWDNCLATPYDEIELQKTTNRSL